MNPIDYGLPPKFTQFWPGQLDEAIAIAASDHRWVLDSMPTGAGKTLIYITAARLLGARTMVLTANKGLQKQINDDRLVDADVRGQANYPCRMLKDRVGWHGCDKGPCHSGQFCEFHPHAGEAFVPGCAFYDQLALIRNSRLCVTNYDFWMSANRYMEFGILGKFDLLILDEAHDAPDKLSDFCTVTIKADECDEFLDSGLPPVAEGVDAWVDWAIQKAAVMKLKLESIRIYAVDDADLIRRAKDFYDRLNFIATAHSWHRSNSADPTVSMPGQQSDWVAEPTGEGDAAIFSPVWAHGYAERFLWVGIPKVVLVSATILPRTAKYLGIPEGEFEWREHKSGYNPKRRPVYLMPVAHWDRNSTDGEKRMIQLKMDNFITARLDRKGIIHPHSYDRAYETRMGSIHKSRMIWHKRGAKEVDAAVYQFKTAGPGTILNSPVVETGYNFPYEECEYQIIVKVPFPDTRSGVMRARVKSDKTYQDYLTLITLIQICGRPVRASDDSGETIIFDANIRWWMGRMKKLGMIPGWFKEALVWANSLPSPLPKIVRPKGVRAFPIDRR